MLSRISASSHEIKRHVPLTLVMPLPQLPKRLVAVHQLSPFGLREAMLDLCRNVAAILSEPLFLFMQHLNSLGNEFVGRLIRSAFHVLLDKSL